LSVVRSIWSHSVLSVNWNSESILSVEVSVLVVGVKLVVVVLAVSTILVVAQKSLDDSVVSHTTKRVPAQSPGGHVALAVNASGAPSELHRSVGRNNRVGCASSVRVSIASEREDALVGERAGAIVAEDTSLAVGESVGLAADRAIRGVLVVATVVGWVVIVVGGVVVVLWRVLWVVWNVVVWNLRISDVRIRENRERRISKTRVESHASSVTSGRISLAFRCDHWAGTVGRGVVLLLVQADNRGTVGAQSESTSNVSVLLTDQFTESFTVTIDA
jgi:hypothetical protein